MSDAAPEYREFRVELVDSLDALQTHRAAYERLLAGMSGGVRRSHSIEALQVSAPLYLGPHETPWFLLAWHGDELRGVAPLTLRRRGWPRLRRLHGWGDINGLLGLDTDVLVPDRDDVTPCLQAFTRFIEGPGAGTFDVMVLVSVREDSVLGRHLQAAMPDAVRRIEDEMSHLAELPATSAAFRAALDAGMLKDVARRERALQRAGRVEFCSRDRLLPDELEGVMAIHSARQTDLAEQGKERLHVFDAPIERQAFLQQVARDERLGQARHHLLKVDGRVVAFSLGHSSDGVTVGHTTAFDPEYRKFGLGRLIALRMIEAEIDQYATRRIDMGKGTTSIKRDFGNRRIGHVQFEWTNTRSLRSRLRLWLWDILSQATSLRRRWFSRRLSPVVSTSVITQ